MSDNIILIGYRGSGKSSVAREIARQSHRTVYSTDDLIERRFGKIENLVREHGWAHFRALERQLLQEFRGSHAVLDCGGGIVENDENRARLKSLGTVFWLTADSPTIRARLSGSQNRPALTQDSSFLDEIPDILRRREPLYRALADICIDTKDKSITAVASEVMARIDP